MRRWVVIFAAFGLLGWLVPGTASAVTAGAVTTDDRLLTFDTGAPGTVTSGPRAISGLQPGETVLGIDVRPQTNQVYALGSSSRLYRINTATAAATQVGSGSFEIPLSGSEFGFDFNPTVDRIRNVSDADQNFRLNPDTAVQIDFNGAMPGLQLDQNLAYAGADPNAGANPAIAGIAYANNYAGATTTTVFGIDTGIDRLVTLNPPNNGTLNTVGPLSFNAEGAVGFDIWTTPAAQTAFATMGTPSPMTSQLYTVNLTTGAVTPVGNVGGGSPVKAFAVGVPPSIEQPPPAVEPTPDPEPDPGPTQADVTAPETLLALTASQKLQRVLKSGGIDAELSCDEACTATATLSAGRKTVGSGTSSLGEAGVGTIEVDLNAVGEKFLKKRRKSDANKTKLGLAISVTDSASNATDLARKLTLKH